MSAASGRPETMTAVGDDPRAYIAGDRRRALAAGRELPDRVGGAALFADISGFTPLTEALANELGPQRGAEELVANLNRMLAAIIEDLHCFGGEVIYFSGDAITCWIDGDDGTRATACALRMQQTMDEVGTVHTEGGARVELRLKAAVAVGQARRFVVGDPDLQLVDVLAGSLIDDLAAAEGVADPGEVVLTESSLDCIPGGVVVAQTRHDAGAVFAVVTSVGTEVEEQTPPRNLETLPDAITREWLLPTVYERLSSGGGAFFAELRTVFPMFIRFGGFDFDADERAAEKLDDFVRRAQRILDDYGGSLLQLTLGDKGAYLYGVFGSPRVHGDEATRSVSAALELEALADVTAASGIQIGISTGRVLSGTCGHPLRRTFACLGDPVNLAARLMSQAPARHVLVTDEVVAAADGKFLWDQLAPMELKGKAETVTAFQLSGVRTGKVRRHSRYPLPMVGRENELRFIENRMNSALSGMRRVVGIRAEAGLGKSRLVAEVVRNFRAAGHRVVFGEAEAIGRRTSYLAWREPWRTLFGIDDLPEGAQAAAITQALSDLGEGRAIRAPLLGNLLEIDIADNAVTSSFDPKLRKASLESLLSEILETELKSRPLVIVLEDSHWIDAASLDLLEVLVRDTASMPLLVVVAYRSEIDAKVRGRLLDLPTYEELVLEELSPSDVEPVIAAKLEQQFGGGVSAARAVTDMIAERGNGNPFYIEELVNFLKRHGIDPSDPAALTQVDIPESLQALVLRRVDSLDPRPRQTLKVASVIGREFNEPMIPGVYPDLGTKPEVLGYVEELGDADLIVRSRQGDDAWLFRHAVTREVAYEGIPYQMRTRLHEAAGAYLEQRREAIGFNLDLIAHHYWYGENQEKKIEYLRRAGEAAQRSYANSSAIDYYERLAEVVEQAERSSVLLKLGEVLELVGDWDRAEAVEREALDLAEAAGDLDAVGWCQVGLAEVARKQGRYDEAAELLNSAAARFGEVGNLAGRGRVLHLAGTIAAQRGDLDEAGRRYVDSLAIREEIGDRAGIASLLSNLGVVAEYSGDLAAARRNHERALATRIEVGDRWAIAVSNTNLGMIAVLEESFEEARDRFEEAMRLNEEVGDSWMVAVGHNNLGNALRGLGDTAGAKAHYAVSAEEYRSYGDRWATAFLLEDVAILAMDTGAPIVGIELLGAADTMRNEIDTPRADSLSEELERRAADCCSVESERSRARRRGRGLDFAAALAHVTAFCTAANMPADS